MSKRLDTKCLIAHPEVLAIALDVTLNPERRQHYSALVLHLADTAAEHLRAKLMTNPGPKADSPYTVVGENDYRLTEENDLGQS